MADDHAPALYTILDSGAPEGVTDYTTIVAIHGLMWNGNSFRRLASLAPSHNARVIVPNRRDYPGARPYTDAERTHQLARLARAPPESKDAAAEAQDFIAERAREVYEYLAELVVREGLPRAQRAEGRGGIVLVGWSLGTVWATAFLAHAPAIAAAEAPAGGVAGVELREYVRRVVAHDGIAAFFGYGARDQAYNPFYDDALSLEQRIPAFHEWISAYWDHGEVPSLGTSMARKGLDEPSSTLDRMSAEERELFVTPGPGKLDTGSDTHTMMLCGIHGLYGMLKDASFYLDSDAEASGGWDDVEVRVVWCDHSIWSSAWASEAIKAELEEAATKGKATRNINLVRIRGANHFAHWDFPEETLRAFLDAGAGGRSLQWSNPTVPTHH